MSTMALSPAPLGSREEKKSFYKNTLLVTLPIVFQYFMDAAVGCADVLMLTLVENAEIPLAAASLANQITFTVGNLVFGLSSAAGVMAAQYFGKGDKKTVEKVLGLACRLALILGLFFTLLTAIIPGPLMSLFSKDPAVIEAGKTYLLAVCASYVLSAFAQVYLSVMRSAGRVRMSMLVHSLTVVMNVVLNACFIFGFGPFPELGILGVALATTISRVIEVIICLVDGRVCKIIRLRVKYILQKAGTMTREFMRMAIPSAGNDVIWGLAISVYSAILGHLSTDITAANSIANVVRQFGTVICFGTASAAAIILGQAMGDNKLAEAKVYAKRFIALAVITALIGGAAILLLRPVVMDYMHYYVDVSSPEVQQNLNQMLPTMLFINAYYILGMSLNTMLICGIFRAGGDVKYGFFCDLIAMWGYAVPVGLICAFWLKLPVMWVYFILYLDEFVKFPVNLWHYKKGTWLKNITRDDI